jgi:hypothetical protein
VVHLFCELFTRTTNGVHFEIWSIGNDVGGATVERDLAGGGSLIKSGLRRREKWRRTCYRNGTARAGNVGVITVAAICRTCRHPCIMATWKRRVIRINAMRAVCLRS